MAREQRFRILVGVALADGRLDVAERDLLLRCSSWLGIPRPFAGRVVHEVRQHGPGPVDLPTDPVERGRMFRGVLNVVLADGQVSHLEHAAMRALGASFSLSVEEVDAAIARANRRWLRAAQVSTSGEVAAPVTTGVGTTEEGAAPGPAEVPLGPGSRVADRFTILSVLGHGGCGAVFRARHEDLDEEVALKLLHRAELGADTEAEQRFLCEVKLARSFVHRYAVTLREFGRDRALGCLYCTMDRVRGHTLEKVIRIEGQQPPARVARLGTQILEALAEAHRLGIVHRDLKPANVMITTSATGEEEVRVLDFGIAKAVGTARGLPNAKLTQAGTIVGTPTYMSPEQAQGEAVDARSDLYSLAVVLYEALTGCLPYEIDPDTVNVQQAIYFQILAEPPRDPALLAAMPRALGDVLLRALAKEPRDRFPDARAFQEALVESVVGADRAAARLKAWLQR